MTFAAGFSLLVGQRQHQDPESGEPAATVKADEPAPAPPVPGDAKPDALPTAKKESPPPSVRPESLPLR